MPVSSQNKKYEKSWRKYGKTLIFSFVQRLNLKIRLAMRLVKVISTNLIIKVPRYVFEVVTARTGKIGIITLLIMLTKKRFWLQTDSRFGTYFDSQVFSTVPIRTLALKRQKVGNLCSFYRESYVTLTMNNHILSID